MRRVLYLATAALVLVAVPATSGAAAPANPAHTFTFAAYGDAPYGTNPTDTAEFRATPAFIDSVNADRSVGFVVHVGDIHSGKQYCTEAYDESIAALWTAYRKPLIYTPGDNEWADCHKAGEGGGTANDYALGDPLANLDLIRSIFFARPGHTLGDDLPVLSQAQVPDPFHPTDQRYVENVLHVRDGVVFVTMNIPGGSDNDADPWFGAPAASAPQLQEAADRTGADLRWLDLAFAAAGLIHARGVVVVEQSDMWDLDGKDVSHIANYEPFVAALARHTTAYGGPVLLLDGDSHAYRSDNPLAPGAPCLTEAPGGVEVACTPEDANHPGYDVPNFHRITVHGSTFPLEWLKITVTVRGTAPTGPDSFGPFSWVRMTQP